MAVNQKQNISIAGSNQTSKKIQEIRRRRKARRLRTFIIFVLLALTVSLYILGAFNVPLAVGEQLINDIIIALEPGEGFPVFRDLQSFKLSDDLVNGAAVMLDSELLIYSAKGNLLRTVPHSYINPVISTSNNSVCMYSTGGARLSVESRTQTKFTHEYTSAIQLAKLSQSGNLAVFTKNELVVYDKYFNEVWSWQAPTQIPLGIEFAKSNNNFAVATLNTENALTNTYIYLYNINSGTALGTITAQNAMPIKMAYTQNELIVVYNTFTAVYDAKTGEKKAEYVYDIAAVSSVDIDESGNVAILFKTENYPGLTKLVLCDKLLETVVELNVQSDASYVKFADGFAHLVYEKEIETYEKQQQTDTWQLLKKQNTNDVVFDIIDANVPLYVTQSGILPIDTSEDNTA